MLEMKGEKERRDEEREEEREEGKGEVDEGGTGK